MDLYIGESVKCFMVVCNGAMAKHHVLRLLHRNDPMQLVLFNWEVCILGQENGTGLQYQYADNKVIIGSG